MSNRREVNRSILKSIPKILASDPSLHMMVFITDAETEDGSPVHIIGPPDDVLGGTLMLKIQSTLSEHLYVET